MQKGIAGESKGPWVALLSPCKMLQRALQGALQDGLLNMTGWALQEGPWEAFTEGYKEHLRRGIGTIGLRDITGVSQVLSLTEGPIVPARGANDPDPCKRDGFSGILQ